MDLDDRLTLGLGLPYPAIESPYSIAQTPDARLHIAESLCELDMSYWVSMGTSLVRDPSSRVRGEIALSLGVTGQVTAIQLLDKLSSDGVWQVREKVALAAYRHGSEAVLPLVIRLMDDHVPQVRAAATKAFIRLHALHPEAVSNLGDLELPPATLSTVTERVQRMLTGEPKMVRIAAPFSSDEKNEYAVPESRFDLALTQLGIQAKDQFLPEELVDEPLEGDEVSMRYVNSWFVDHPDPLEPLRFGQEYELGIEISPKLRVGSLTKGKPDLKEPEYGEQDTLDVVVAIVTDDFKVLEKPGKRMTLSKNKLETSPTVTFKVRPIKNNQEVFITVLFYHKNNLFHEALIGARVQVLEARQGTIATVYFPTENRLGRAPFHGHRDVNLQVVELEDGSGYRLILFYDFGDDKFDVMWCKIPITRNKIAELLKGVRNDMLAAVQIEGKLANKKTGKIFFDGESPPLPLKEKRLPKLYRVDDAVYGSTLKLLARAGRKLYVNLFDPVKGSHEEKQQASRIGEALRQLSSNQALKIQVLSDDFFIPWNLFYDGDYPTAEVDSNEFWGFKHVIEEVPYHTSEAESEHVISVEENVLQIGMNINRTNLPEVLTSPQLALMQELGDTIQVSTRFTEKDVLTALHGHEGQHQLEYFYCHAGTGGDPEKNFDQSYLGLTKDNTGLTLEDIKLATVGGQFHHNPLFILNACESVQMDGRFYDGFVPKFLNMGACAVVGTDCEVPSLFAAHFGIAFLRSFLEGNSIGEAMLGVQKHFLGQYQNPLGLIYRIFGNADVYISRNLI